MRLAVPQHQKSHPAFVYLVKEVIRKRVKRRTPEIMLNQVLSLGIVLIFSGGDLTSAMNSPARSSPLRFIIFKRRSQSTIDQVEENDLHSVQRPGTDPNGSHERPTEGSSPSSFERLLTSAGPSSGLLSQGFFIKFFGKSVH